MSVEVWVEVINVGYDDEFHRFVLVVDEAGEHLH